MSCSPANSTAAALITNVPSGTLIGLSSATVAASDTCDGGRSTKPAGAAATPPDA